MFKNMFQIAIALLILLPLGALLAHSLLDESDVFSFLMKHVLSDYILNSLYLSGWVSLLSTIIGIGCAWFIVHYRFPLSKIIEIMLLLPMAFPAYIVAYAYTDLWGESSVIPIRSLGGAIFTMTLCFYPYIYLFARTGFLKHLHNTHQVDAGRLFKTTPFEQIAYITWPNARPYIMIGIALVLMEVLVDYGTVSYFNIKVFSTGIYNAWIGYGDTVAAARLSIILLAFIFFLLLLERENRKAMRFSTPGTERVSPPEIPICTGTKGFIMTFLCVIPVVLGFIIPTLILINLSLDHVYFQGIGILVLNTIKLGALVGFVSIILTYLVVVIKRQSRSSIIKLFQFISGFGYALPGIVLGLGLMLIAQWIGVISSLSLLIIGYLIRFWTIPTQSIEAGFDKISPTIDDASRLMRQNSLSEFWYIRLPLLWPAFLSGFLIVFVDVIKELPLTLVMRPLNYNTLAVEIYQLTADERLAEAAFPSLIIMVCGLIPVIILSRLIKRS